MVELSVMIQLFFVREFEYSASETRINHCALLEISWCELTTDVSVIIRCQYCGSEIKVGNGELLKPPTPNENVWWAGSNPPNPTKIRLKGVCDAHEIGNQDFSASFPTTPQ
jgi:hypothetical protein